MIDEPRIALAHDWFVNRGGAERVALTLASMYPDAPMFTALAHPEMSFPEVGALELRTTSLQQRIRDPRRFRRALRRYPAAWAELDATGFEVVVASTAAFAHHLRTDGCLIAYCHQPPRFLHDPAIAKRLAPWFARPILPAVLAGLRRLDLEAAARVHRYVANSKVTAERIERLYGVRASVVHPPIETHRFAIAPRTQEHWLVVSRLLPHRDVELAIRAFTEMRMPLVVVGDGSDRQRLEAIAGSSVRFLGAIDDETLITLYGEARGVVVPGIEDLGMVALEANASGRPVVARGVGGALETVIDGLTGTLFVEADPSALARAVRRAEELAVDPQVLRSHAERFDRRVFEAKIRDLVAARTACLACQRSAR
jgi:glycosyltransferase involved in cell wall biosynthesis